MLAYHSDAKQKSAILRQLRAHAKADEIVKGRYWENGRGCAVGCAIHSGNHSEYEPRFGIPIQLAYLEDQIFESLENGESKTWPIRFMSAIKSGADLSTVWPDFAVWLLTDAQHGVLRFADNAKTRNAIEDVATLYSSRVPSGDARWVQAQYAADAVYTSVAADAYAAAYAADVAADAYAAAAYAADVAADAGSRSKAYRRFWLAASEKLLALLKAAPVERARKK